MDWFDVQGGGDRGGEEEGGEHDHPTGQEHQQLLCREGYLGVVGHTFFYTRKNTCSPLVDGKNCEKTHPVRAII